MSQLISVTMSDGGSFEFDLGNGKHRVGRSADCEVRIDHAEIDNLAAQIEVRGATVFIQNRNPYAIYVGAFELAPNQQAEWPIGQTVALTLSVSLHLVDRTQPVTKASEEFSAKKRRSTFQIAVVIACVVVAYFMLTNDSKKVDAGAKLDYDFTSLVRDIEALPPPTKPEEARQRRTMLNYMLDARVPDVRWGQEDPRRAIQAYELLLDVPAIKKASDEESLEGRIKKFALARLSTLSGQIKEDY